MAAFVLSTLAACGLLPATPSRAARPDVADCGSKQSWSSASWAQPRVPAVASKPITGEQMLRNHEKRCEERRGNKARVEAVDARRRRRLSIARAARVPQEELPN